MEKIKEKKVGLIELFYDLIYVYSISKMTSIIRHPHEGVVSGVTFYKYVIVALIILQVWLYLTNFINRFGDSSWFEKVAICINMLGALFLNNTLTSDWSVPVLFFNTAMIVMLSSVALLYLLKSKESAISKAAFKAIIILILIYIFAIVLDFYFPRNVALAVNTLGIILGITLPVVMVKEFDNSIVSFPHLTERFELLTIITFGESVVTISDYFKIENFGINSIIAFGIIILLFGCYVVNNHNMLNSHQSTRGLVWMYSHFAIIISINLLTVAVDFAVKNDVNFIFLVKLIIVSMLVYYAALFSDSIYYYKNIKLSKNDILLSLLMIAIGMAVIIIGSGNNSFTLLGVFITVCGNFVLLTKKYYGVKYFCNKA